MAPLKKKIEKVKGKKKNMITMEVKKELIKKHEEGMRVADIARFYNKSTSTICTILKKKEDIKKIIAAKGITTVSKQRPSILDNVEKMLLSWIKEKQSEGDTVSANFICEKAKILYDELLNELPRTSNEPEKGFKASRGWFDNFKRRSGIYSFLKNKKSGNSGTKLLEKPMERKENEENIQKKMVKQREELIPHELINLHCEQQSEVIKQKSSKEKETKQEYLNLDETEEICKLWEKVQHFVERHHPNKAVAISAMNLFNEIAMSHFREILKNRRKQLSLDRFLVKIVQTEKNSSEKVIPT